MRVHWTLSIDHGISPFVIIELNKLTDCMTDTLYFLSAVLQKRVSLFALSVIDIIY